MITARPEDEEKKKKKKKRKHQKKRVLADDEPKPDPYWLQSFFGFAPEEAEKLPCWGHCGVLSPLLANVLLDELDKWIEGKIKEFYRPSKSDVIWNGEGRRKNRATLRGQSLYPLAGPIRHEKWTISVMVVIY